MDLNQLTNFEIIIKQEPEDDDEQFFPITAETNRVNYDSDSDTISEFPTFDEFHESVQTLVSFEDTIKVEPTLLPETVSSTVESNEGTSGYRSIFDQIEENGKKTVEKKFQCEICGKSFKNNYPLMVHMRIHTGEKPYACEICHKRFRKKNAVKEHITIHTGEEPYSCEICHKRFRKIYTLKVHKRIHSGEEPYTCKICHKGFKKNDNLKVHMRNHTGELPFPCELCEKKFRVLYQLKLHMTRNHGCEKRYACDICPRRFNFKDNLKVHMREHTGERPFACEICDKSFKTKRLLDNHLSIHTGERPYSCDMCDKTFKVASHVKIHVHKIHSVGCKQCPNFFSSQARLDKHVDLVHQPRLILQPDCPGSSGIEQQDRTSSIENLQTAAKSKEPADSYPVLNGPIDFAKETVMILNTVKSICKRMQMGKQKLFSCEICHKKFKKNYNLKVHKRIHTGDLQQNKTESTLSELSSTSVSVKVEPNEETTNDKQTKQLENGKPGLHLQCGECGLQFTDPVHTDHVCIKTPYQCGVCNKSFSKESILSKHTSRVHKAKTIECEFCQESFKTIENLKVHIRTHSVEWKFKCSICYESFRKSYNLKVHLRSHADGKPFPCKMCPKKFKSLINLNVHVRNHSNERVYSCKICNTKLKEPYQLRRHMRGHVGEKLYACEICSTRFKDSYLLKIHMRYHSE